MALIRDAVQRLHQLDDLSHRVVRRHARAGMPENGRDRFFPNVGLAQPRRGPAKPLDHGVNRLPYGAFSDQGRGVAT